jgi:hypothetical protein
MVNLDVLELRPNLELENKYVDFSVLRTALSVEQILRDLNVSLTEPSKEGECRGKCPKCEKEKSFSFNINNNRFNCFAKGCVLKGGGVIDFFARLHEISAKEASHFLACAYGIQPYTSEKTVAVSITAEVNPKRQKAKSIMPESENAPKSGEVSHAEFEKLEKKFERLSIIVWSLMFEKDEIDEPITFDSIKTFDGSKDYELETSLSG